MEGERRISGFVRTMMIIDIVMCVVRMMLAFLGTLAVAASSPAGNLTQTLPFEAGFGWGIAIFGLCAAGLVLAKKPVGVILGWICLAFVALSLVISLWQVAIMSQSAASDVERVGVLIGAGAMFVVRAGYNAAYGGLGASKQDPRLRTAPPPLPPVIPCYCAFDCRSNASRSKGLSR